MRAWLLLTIAVVACGAAGPSLTDGGPPDGAGLDSPITKGEAGPNATYPNIVFVNGLVNGVTHDTAGASLNLDDVRVCVSSSGTMLTQYALPDDTPLPYTNYAGVHRGSGVDLGSFVDPSVTIHVFTALSLKLDAAWTASRQPCSQIACDQTTCVPHVSLPATLSNDVNVVALVDQTDDAGASVTLQQASYDTAGFNGAPGFIYASVVNFSAWPADNAYYATENGSMTYTAIVDPLSLPFAVHLVTNQVTSYETYGIMFNHVFGGQRAASFWQSLDSVAFVTNPTSDPPSYYAVRKNFVVALVGDAADLTSATQNNGRNPSFDGRGLHIIAVPYAEPRSK